MGKTPLILAPIVVGAAVLFVVFLAGRWWERSMKRYASSFIDPATYTDLVELLRRILTPAADVDQACFLPDGIKDEAERLVTRADNQDTNRRRAELRRRGF